MHGYRGKCSARTAVRSIQHTNRITSQNSSATIVQRYLCEATTPTRVHQRLSQNNLRKRQISCETTANLAKWTNIVSKNYEPNRENYAPDCARFCDGILHEKCLEIHANTENAVLFFCNGVVIDLLHFNSEKRRCQGLSKRIIVTSLCWTQTQTMFGSFFFSKRNFCWF